MTETLPAEKFGEDYFLRGQETGASNFSNYRWLPDSTISWAKHFMRYMDLKPCDRTMEIGCARGYYVKALRVLGVDAYGYDISQWAIANCDPAMVPFLSNHLNVQGAEYDVTYSKDTFEHVSPDQLGRIIRTIIPATKRRLFAIVPLAKETNGVYVHPKEEMDTTHVNRWTMTDWLQFLGDHALSCIVSGSFMYPGLKPGAHEVECGYGFLSIDKK